MFRMLTPLLQQLMLYHQFDSVTHGNPLLHLTYFSCIHSFIVYLYMDILQNDVRNSKISSILFAIYVSLYFKYVQLHHFQSNSDIYHCIVDICKGFRDMWIGINASDGYVTLRRLVDEGKSGGEGRDVGQDDLPEERQRSGVHCWVLSRWKVNHSGERRQKGLFSLIFFFSSSY